MMAAAHENEQDAAIVSAPVRNRPKPRVAASPWGVNVMLVDDDPADTSLILGLMKRHPSVGAAVGFSDPDRALAALAGGERQPDLILLDISMPKTDGFGFMRAIDQMAYVRDTPIVLLTTSRFLRDVEQARDTMACGYVVKPDTLEELRRRLDIVVKQTISGKWS